MSHPDPNRLNVAALQYKPGDALRHCERILEKHDSELCKGYREEIDTLLVFAGLFSAVVTAFCVESYQWLQSDPNDAVIALLSQISEALAQNASVALPAQPQFGPAPSVATRINAYWFVSLTLSLSSALGAILCKQWIREFERYVGLSAQDFVAIRQTRFEGLERWKVGAIISALPLLLQLSLAIFSLGIVDLLWHLHAGVAIAVCVPAVCTLLFYVATTLMPVIQHQLVLLYSPLRETLSLCPYKSPQSLLAIRAYTSLHSAWLHLARRARSILKRAHGARPRDDYPVVRSWIEFDREAEQWDTLDSRPYSLFSGLLWMKHNMKDADDLLMHCVWELASAPNPRNSVSDGISRFLTQMIPYAGILDDPPADACPRALALIYFTRLPLKPCSGFVIETVCHNLPHLHPFSAAFLITALRDHLIILKDPNLAILLVRAVSSYARSQFARLSESEIDSSGAARKHAANGLGYLIVALADVALCWLDEQSLPPARGAIAVLFLEWLRGPSIVNASACIDQTRALLMILLGPYQWCTGGPSGRLHRLRDEQNVEDVAELLEVYCGLHGVSIPWPGEDCAALSRILFGDWSFSAVLTELLSISFRGPNTGDDLYTSCSSTQSRMSCSSTPSGQPSHTLDPPLQFALQLPRTTHAQAFGEIAHPVSHLRNGPECMRIDPASSPSRSGQGATNDYMTPDSTNAGALPGHTHVPPTASQPDSDVISYITGSRLLLNARLAASCPELGCLGGIPAVDPAPTQSLAAGDDATEAQ